MLHACVAPRGHVPEHRETVGDRMIDDGNPSIWIVLASFGGGDVPAIAAVGGRRAPTLRTSAQIGSSATER